MRVCVHETAVLITASHLPHTSAPVYLSVLLRTLWFLNLPCSTLATTDKSCLSHRSGFLYIIQKHPSALSASLFMHFMLFVKPKH